MTKKKATKAKGEQRDAISSLLLRLKPDDGRRLETLASKVPWASRSALALAALRLGLQELEADPTKLITDKD